ncbi:serine protease [uncultured Litoreibacter sp.]|uniref:S1 family peptidase n=1 Tax=uncultured Litoreibacter sp. TaxID=1392394 RepID=UPI0026191578|nr:serine protease [uncultured Litoreibacter sp.]
MQNSILCIRLICIALVFGWMPTSLTAQVPAASELTQAEIRSMQAALSFDGSYLGRLDGKWGAGTAAALSQSLSQRQQTKTHAFANLLKNWQMEHERMNWNVLNPEAGISVAYPSALLARETSASDVFSLASSSRSLVFRVIFGTASDAAEMHIWLKERHVGPSEFYQVERDWFWVSNGTLRSGKQVYLKTYLIDGVYMTALVQSERSQRARAQVMIASLSAGWGGLISIPLSGALRQAMLYDEQPNASTGESVNVIQAAPEQEKDEAPSRSGSGTGFYVNNTDVLTAAHVVDGCGRLSLEDGSPLRLINHNEVLDVALLSAVTRSKVWLPIQKEVAPKLGEKVYALGFPYLGLYDQGLSVTGGNVSALPNTLQDNARVMVSAPIQPGNSGGPLINEQGEVIGIVVSRANDIGVLGLTGTIPQNMNFVTSVQSIQKFLSDNNVVLPTSHTAFGSMENGIPESIQDATVVVLCH